MTTDHAAVADVLDDAADYIEKNGWTQRPGGRQGASRCAGLALCEVMGGPAHGMAFCRHVGLRAVREIPDWNDDPNRTEQQVLDAFRLAAKSERRLADES